MQNNNFRGFSSNSRYNQNMGNAGGFQNSISLTTLTLPPKNVRFENNINY